MRIDDAPELRIQAMAWIKTAEYVARGAVACLHWRLLTCHGNGPTVLANLTAPGAPFELVDAAVRGTRCRVFKLAPQSLAELYPAARVHDSKVLAVLGEERVT